MEFKMVLIWVKDLGNRILSKLISDADSKRREPKTFANWFVIVCNDYCRKSPMNWEKSPRCIPTQYANASNHHHIFSSSSWSLLKAPLSYNFIYTESTLIIIKFFPLISFSSCWWRRKISFTIGRSCRKVSYLFSRKTKSFPS